MTAYTKEFTETITIKDWLWRWLRNITPNWTQQGETVIDTGWT